MNHFDNFFNGKKILVTGHTGFKGSWLCSWLNALGADITGFSLEPNSQPNMFSACNIEHDVNSIIADIRDYSAIEKAIIDNEPEIIFHLAAQPLVLESYKSPLNTFQTNVIGTANILEAIRLRGKEFVKSVVIVTSDKCYENNEKGHSFVEEDKLGGKDPYSSSKASAEIITNAYYNSFFINKSNVSISTVRAGNVIGGGDWSANRLIPDCMRSLSNNKDIIIRNPNSTRPWQHVLDPLCGYLNLSKNMYSDSSFCGAWNFGPFHESVKTVTNVVNSLCDLWPESKSSIEFLKINKSVKEAKLLSLDSTKATKYLGWRPRLDFQRSIELTVGWYKSYYNSPELIKELVTNQINRYYG